MNHDVTQSPPCIAAGVGGGKSKRKKGTKVMSSAGPLEGYPEPYSSDVHILGFH